MIETDINTTINKFQETLSCIRGANITPSLIENITINYYGSNLKLKQIASISFPAKNTIYITPFDRNCFKPISDSISNSNLGLGISSSKDSIIINIPYISGDQYIKIIKLIEKNLEDSKIIIRNIRRSSLKEIDKNLPEDEINSIKLSIESLVKEKISILDKIAKSKIEELNNFIK